MITQQELAEKRSTYSPLPPRAKHSLLGSLWKRARRVAMSGLVFGVVGVLWAVLSPVYFQSSASILPETRSRLGGQLSGSASMLLSGLSGGLLDGGTSPQFYAELFRSRSVLEFVLAESFRVDSSTAPKPLEAILIEKEASPRRHEDALLKLRKLTAVEFDSRTGIVTLSVYASSPTLARDVAAAFISAVSEFDVKKRQSRAKLERQFVESRFDEARAELRKAEDAVRVFETANRGWEQSPSLRTTMEQLRRESSIRQELYLATARQVQDARLQEVRDTPVFSVIDPPDLPARKALPKRSRLVLALMAFGVLLGFAWPMITSRLATFIESA